MTAADPVAELADAGIEVWEEDGTLRYRAPRGTMTPERLELLRARRGELVAMLRGARAAIVPDLAARHEPFPLTDVQLAYLLGRKDVFAYGGIGCHGYGELEYSDLDPARLETAWATQIRRHDMLRAIISADGTQRVLAEVPSFTVGVLDVRGVSHRRVTAAIEAVRADMSHRVYDPGAWPLFDLRVTLADERAVLHFSIDLLIADFVSTRRLLDELHLLYSEPGRQLPPPAITFRDYVLAERRSRTARERDRGYWMKKIDQLPSAPELAVIEPADGGADPGSARFRRWQTLLEPDAWAALRARAGREGVTPSGCVLAAYAEVIGRWSRGRRFTLDVTLLNRLPLHPDVTDLVGDFTSVELLAFEPEVGAPLRDRVRAVQAQLWEDLDHRQYSGLDVMRDIARRHGQAAALYPVVFTSAIGAEAAAGAAGQPSGVAAFTYGITQTPQVWIDCQVMENQGGLSVNWDVREQVFPDGMVDDMFAAFVGLLRAMAADRGEDVWARTEPVGVPTRQAERRRALLTATAASPSLLHANLVAAALRHPETAAVITSGNQLTFGELLARACAVARRLEQAGHAQGDIVGVLIDKGAEQVVAVLAILLAGGAYLPVDTGQPAIRRNQMLTDAGVRRVLTQAWHSRDDGLAWPAINVDEVPPAPWPPELPARPADPADLAYVIYTSGSTGRPKGVMITHGSAVNTVNDVSSRFGVNARDRTLGLASLGFDLSVYDIFGQLGVGGQLVLPDAGRRGDPSHWAELMREHGVTVWNSVPAQMQMLTQYLDAEPGITLPALRLALLSGDWLPVALAVAVRSRWPDLDLISLGGATEAAIWSIWHPIGEVHPGSRSIPYGIPLSNQSVGVLDGGLRPCPDWTTGDLYIGGDGLAVGYLGDPGQTAQRFISHPATGQRLYHTGDLGRYLPGGVIEFLGREDSQVKIRGHRIELGEIEAVAMSHPCVGSAAAVVHEEPGAQRQLAAFVTGASRDARLRDRGRADVAQAGLAAAQAAATGLDIHRYAEFVRRLDHAALAAMRGALGTQPIAPRYSSLVTRWQQALDEAGTVSAAGADIERSWRDIEEAAAGVAEPVLLDYYRVSMTRLPELLSGSQDPLQLLFPGGRSDVARALYEHAPASRWSSQVVAAVIRQIAAVRPGPRILEVGAGTGAASAQVLAALADREFSYLFTDLSTFFVTEAAQRLASYPQVRFRLFDLDQDYRAQGFEPNSFDVILATDVLHAVHDTEGSLRRLAELLAPGGWLVLTEMTRNHPHVMATLQLMLDPGVEQRFRSREQWRACITAAGGDVSLLLPDPGDPLGEIGFCVLAAHFKADRHRVSAADLAGYLADRLPEYMLPGHIQVVDTLPLTTNGKVDRKALPGWLPSSASRRAPAADQGAKASSELDRRIAAIWSQVIGYAEVGLHQGFLDAGGDSLLAARLAGQLREQLPEASDTLFDELLRRILQGATVTELGAWLSGPDPAAAVATAVAADTGALAIAQVLAGQPTAGQPALVLIHDADGGLAGYDAITAELAAATPVLGMAVNNDEMYLRIDSAILPERLAREHAQVLSSTGCRPLYLAGRGFGGVIAVEVARQLAEMGIGVAGLALIGGGPLPGRDDGGPAPDEDLSAHSMRAARTHRPMPYAGDITVAWPGASGASCEETVDFWRELCLGAVRVIDIPGDLDTCMRPPHAARLGAALADEASGRAR